MVATNEKALRIAVADDESDTRQYFKELVQRLGHQVVVTAENGRELVEGCRSARPELVITDIMMPDMDGLQAAEELNRDGAVPVILVAGRHEPDLLARAGAEYIMAYLSKPARPVDLQAAIGLAIRRFDQFQTLRDEAAGLRQALADRKIVERAKESVVKRLHISEEDAFRRIRKLANDTNLKLVEIAQRVLTADEVFRSLDRL